jgi:RHS repeat-associated protein
MDPIADGTTKITRTPAGTAISTLVAGAARTAITNTHGDHVAAIDGTGNVSNTRNYEPYGTMTASTGSGAPTIGYQSDWTDPSSSNVWMGARFYSPGLASFMSRDTYGGKLESPVSLNRYTYANNNPLKYFDPTGHYSQQSLDDCVAIYGSNGIGSGDATTSCGSMLGAYENCVNSAWSSLAGDPFEPPIAAPRPTTPRMPSNGTASTSPLHPPHQEATHH